MKTAYISRDERYIYIQSIRWAQSDDITLFHAMLLQFLSTSYKNFNYALFKLFINGNNISPRFISVQCAARATRRPRISRSISLSTTIGCPGMSPISSRSIIDFITRDWSSLNSFKKVIVSFINQKDNLRSNISIEDSLVFFQMNRTNMTRAHKHNVF